LKSFSCIIIFKITISLCQEKRVFALDPSIFLPELEHRSLLSLSVYGKVSQISAIYLFLCVFYAMLRYKSFKIRVNCLIELIKIYENMVLTSFLDLFQPPSMRISLMLHLNFVHIKPQQPNRFDFCTDTA